MEEDESLEELNFRARKNLTEIFGPFEEFSERVARNQQTSKHGLIRSKMKPSRSSPFVPIQVPANDSPSHIPVHVALQSMKNLVDEPPLSSLPAELDGIKKPELKKSEKKRKNGEGAECQVDVKRKKEADGATKNHKISARSFTPDSGIHSIESDIPDEPSSDEIATMLNIMKTLGVPQLSPIPTRLLKEFEKEKSREKSMEKEEKAENSRDKEKENSVEKLVKQPKNTKYLSDSSTSSASTSREVTPEPKEPPKIVQIKNSSSSGILKLKGLKPEKLQKLVEIAKKNGKLDSPEQPPRNSPAPPPTKLPNKTVQNLQNSEIARSLSPSGCSVASVPSPRSIRSTTPTVQSRPPSVLSLPESSIPTTSEATTSSTVPSQSTKSTRWHCQWDHAKVKTIQRVPIPDPTTWTKTKGEFYHGLAKDWKSKADREKDRVIRPLNYMLSSIYFVLEAIWKMEKERSQQSRMQCASIYRDTYELLGVAVFQGVRESEDTLIVHMLPRIKILGQIMLSVMQYQMYLFRAEQAIKNLSRLESREVADSIDTRPVSTASNASSSTSNSLAPPTNRLAAAAAPGGASAGSTPSGAPSAPGTWLQSIATCQNTVTMPQMIFDTYKSQLKTANTLILASRYWEDSKSLAKIADATFIKDIETICGKSIGMDMSFDVLAQFVLTAVASLRAEYEEEQKLPVKPEMKKVKHCLDFAIRTGTFHSDRPQQPPQQQRRPAAQQKTQPDAPKNRKKP